MLFGSFFAAYYFARTAGEHSGGWPPEGMHLPVYLALVNTIILVTSSFTVHWAIQSIKRENRAGLIAGLGLTVLLGLTFLLIQAREYTRLGFAPKDNAFATTFFGLTGLHGLHVFVGLTLLTFAFWRAVRGHYSAKHHHGVEVPGIYWHFVDVMWIIVYVTVYVI
jgi:cytochrome c oxidase subunit 3